MPYFGGAQCCLPLHQPSWVRSLRKKKVTIEDLPEDLLLDILSLVPRKDLVLSCRRVCSRWKDLVDLPVLWKRKCQRMGFRLEGLNGGLPDWRTFCFHHSQRNLVKNPCGEESLDFWEMNKLYWKVSEDVVLDRCVRFYKRGLGITLRPPQEVQSTFVFTSLANGVTIYPRAETKRQRITLQEEGYSDWLMDKSRPKIIVKDWHVFSSKSHSELHVKLLSDGLEVLQECNLTSQTSDCSDWWNELSHTFEDYPPGVRHIDLEHEAVAKTFVKITGTSVTIDPEGSREEAAGKSRFFPSLPSTLRSKAWKL